jgi:glutaminyl-peptide cyclotransferase
MQTQAQSPPQPSGERPRGAFAADRFPDVPMLEFDARRTMGYLQAICKIGPRISGSEGMKQQQELIQKHFENLGVKVEYQKFEGSQPSQPTKVEMANMIISWNPEAARRVILCSHYDTRPIADQEPNPRRWHDAFLSANDGGSGVALLMELGNHMKNLKLNVGVDFVLFDGEEYVFRRDEEYFLGSKHFAAQYRKTKAKNRYTAAILLDMIGGKNASFPVEQNSWFKASTLVSEVWKVAADLKCTAFKGNEFSKFAVEDDHIPLNRAGIPAIDIIDFDYAHWHRLTDVPENCSAESMEQVAKVLAVWLQRTR